MKRPLPSPAAQGQTQCQQHAQTRHTGKGVAVSQNGGNASPCLKAGIDAVILRKRLNDAAKRAGKPMGRNQVDT
ncbi:hypothetical protein SDC9_129743 [bioreactor metagenome]|uniref:Uncharacterized protein n=1 Tax=bioreactor metagenome TaxID=1076179 RepID=A0A645D0P6_9ZZZZ